ncbi:MAG: hypothetical protein HYT76_07465 [Deltaproteobacteria bacterium]|nr:hypothetical protein [Deltaproteobacteria bacterium]
MTCRDIQVGQQSKELAENINVMKAGEKGLRCKATAEARLRRTWTVRRKEWPKRATKQMSLYQQPRRV